MKIFRWENVYSIPGNLPSSLGNFSGMHFSGNLSFGAPENMLKGDETLDILQIHAKDILV